MLSKLTSETGLTVKEALATEAIDAGDEYDNMSLPASRVSLYVDENDNVTVAWGDRANTGDDQVTARIYNSDLEPVTESFLVFQSSAIDGGAPSAGINTSYPQVGMTQAGILITSRDKQRSESGRQRRLPRQHPPLHSSLANPLATNIGAWDLY